MLHCEGDKFLCLLPFYFFLLYSQAVKSSIDIFTVLDNSSSFSKSLIFNLLRDGLGKGGGLQIAKLTKVCLIRFHESQQESQRVCAFIH